MNLAIDTLCALASTILLTWAIAGQPDHANAPPGWFIEGVRPDGRFYAMPSPIGGDDWGPQRPGVIEGRIHCTGGTRAIVVRSTRVGCQR